MLLKLVILTVLIEIIKCSRVIDSAGQRGIYLSEYCPKSKHCPEGAHVMCMYYTPRQILGPKCHNAQNVSMTPDLADHLLAISNAVRSKISKGKEKGKNGDLLPRGYGIFKLKWDEELATFAQVLANQCVLKHDQCRETTRFPDPGQTAGLVRFTYPEWFPISKSKQYNKNITQPGLYNAKLIYAVTQTLKSWYSQKSSVTSAMINNYPNWSMNPGKPQDGRLYLEMIYGPATHMGCGLSGYTEYAYYDNTDLIYNSVLIICNYSAKPVDNGPVYNTLPPSDREIPFSKCGCPVGSIADDDCLCSENTSNDPHTMNEQCDDHACDPTVVLLPIFTIEDAPPEKLVHLNNYVNKTIARSNEDRDIFENVENKYLRQAKLEYMTHTNQIPHFYDKKSKRRFSSQPKTKVKKRYFGKKQIESKANNKSLRSLPKHVPAKKISIFARATTFMLPNSKSKSQSTTNSIKKDVVVRKDFSSAKKLADTYIHKQSLLKDINLKNVNIAEIQTYPTPTHLKINRIQNAEPIHNLHELETESTLKVENKTVTPATIEPIESLTSQSDNKLLNLLDTLEQEVKNVELRGPDKEIFDAKIRNIYGKIVGKPPPVTVKLKLPPTTDTERVKELIEKHIMELHDENTKMTTESEHKTLKPHESSFENYSTQPTKDDIEDNINNDKGRSIYLSNNIDEKPYDNTRSLRKHKNYNSFEDKREYSQRDTMNDYSYRKRSYKNDRFEKKHYRDINDRHKNGDELERSNKRHRNYINNGNGDPLSVERRKYYQDKLDNIERRLNRVRSHKRRRFQAPSGRHMRAMVPSERKSENQMDPFYLPDRARTLHGY